MSGGRRPITRSYGLAPFGKAEAEEFLDCRCWVQRGRGRRHAASLQALKQLILEKTEGTPFFMEEVVQTLAEEGVLAGERGSYRRGESADRAAYLPHRARRAGGPHRPAGAGRESLASAAGGDWAGVPAESAPPRHPPTRRRIVSPPRLAHSAKSFSTSSRPFRRSSISSSMP